ncbi:acyl-CoA N-acyltransferase, partial [Polychaeton citri CBS 116435]
MPETEFPYEQRPLRNDVVKLELFDPRTHALPFIEVIKATPEIFRYIPFPVIETKEDFMREFYDEIHAVPGNFLYAVIDTKGNPSGDFAGIVAISHMNPVNAVAEMGIIISPAFRRTHVASNTIGLLLLWLLDPPPSGGLGLRRVEWQCHSENTISRQTALRMGFVFEGIARWQRVFPRGGVTVPVKDLERRNGTKEETPGRHTAIFSLVWDEWDDDKRHKVVAQMAR